MVIKYLNKKRNCQGSNSLSIKEKRLKTSINRSDLWKKEKIKKINLPQEEDYKEQLYQIRCRKLLLLKLKIIENPVYKKRVSIRKKYKVVDKKEIAQVGDVVIIEECRIKDLDLFKLLRKEKVND